MFGIPDDGKMIQGSKRVPDEAMPGCVKPAYLRKIAAQRRNYDTANANAPFLRSAGSTAGSRRTRCERRCQESRDSSRMLMQ
jgi:hypothetical protein